MMFTFLSTPAFLSSNAPTEVATVSASPLILPANTAFAVISVASVLAS